QNTLFSHRNYNTGPGAAAIVLNAESPGAGNMVRWNIRSTQGPNDIVECPTPLYDEWHHYAGVVSLDSVYLYLDGTLVDVVDNTQTGSYDVGVNLVEIGRHYHSSDWPGGYFNGYMDDMRIWGTALDAEKIELVKNNEWQALQDTLLAHWDFGNNDISDISLNGNDGTLMGEARVVNLDTIEFEYGLSLYLDGIDDYASLTAPVIHSTEFTVEVWAVMFGIGGGTDSHNSLFSQRDYSTGTNHSAILLNAENYPAGSISKWNIRSTQGNENVIGAPAPEYGAWHHYTGVVSEDSIRLYIDGILVSSGENTQSGLYDYSIDDIDIGRHYHSSSYHAGYFNGYMDDLKIWSSARTTDQIQGDMFSQLSGGESDLAAYYNFNTGAVEDLSLFQNNGELLNGALIQEAELDQDQCVVMGDVNGNGYVNVSDLQLVLNYVIDGQTAGINLLCADMSGDELINISDLILLVQLILGS
ncbi:MAG: LamG-like jellyroll fold domain-containing protein, partial [Candidatus Marinimicrobia bacterium]|nr:LamG-like jellyroll fold domain-containing protein [Candidatus Neomarinimicrobiota bacterium]